MRMSYSDIKAQFLDDVGFSGSTNPTILSYFQRALSQRYQLMLAKLDLWQTQVNKTFQTSVGQQYYHNPAGFMNMESVTVTLGNIAYPLLPIDSELSWERINQTLITTSAIPQYFYQRRDDFGIWPIPQGVYLGTAVHHIRDRSLTVDDYTTGTATLNYANQVVTGTGTTWTSAMIGRWFVSTTDGYWYRISNVNSPTSLTLENYYEGIGITNDTYRICQTPEIPEEGHILLPWGVAGDFYAGPRKDPAKASYFNNLFWTGDGDNMDRSEDDKTGGLIALRVRYAERSDSRVVTHKPTKTQGNTKQWASSIYLNQ